ncbi:MAG: uroporphyrinogen decarboxylase family protein [Chloroflexota bacterium]
MENKWSIRQRVLAVLEGRKPDRLPFIDRMDFWYKGLSYQGRIPAQFAGKELAQIHQEIGFGMEDWMWPVAFKFCTVEMIQHFEGEEIFHEYEPEITNFPTLWGIIPTDRAGVTTTELITPVGKLVLQHGMLIESVISGTTRPNIVTRPVRTDDDYRAYEYLIEHMEIRPRFQPFLQREMELDGFGYLVPMIMRMPFQTLLIDAIGEVELFFSLHDNLKPVERLLYVLDQQVREVLKELAGLPVPFVEFPDNLEGSMTNPRLFRKYWLPYSQQYAQILHSQGKKMASHTDGDLKSLVKLLPESGLDICESFTPWPITQCTFEEAWVAWEKGPLIWGGIPSYYLEQRLPEAEFQSRIEQILALIGDRPIILGIGDAVMSDNDVERVRWIAQRVEEHVI